LAWEPPGQRRPYGFASNQISDFTFFATGGTVTFAGGTRSTDNAAALTPGVSASTADPVIIPNASDAAQATAGVGPFPLEGTYVPSELTSGVGARADSDTSDGDPLNGGVSFSSNVAESRSLPGPAGSANGRNTAAIAVGVTEGTQIGFQFANDVLMIASTDAIGEAASASVRNDFRILDGLGGVVFDFAPAGLGPRTIQGGSATSDPFSLNQTLAPAAGTLDTVSNGLGDDFFAAISDPLTAGTYTILLDTLSSDTTSSPTLAPEPGSLFLLGTGLTALSLLRRRRGISPPLRG
jgi:hypothetical protein